VNRDTWKGRLYRATDNFYLCSLAQSNKVVDTNDARMTAMKVLTKDGPILLHDCVHVGLLPPPRRICNRRCLFVCLLATLRLKTSERV